MKHLTLTTLLAALVLALMPALASAAEFYPKIENPEHTSTYITPAWRFDMTPPSHLEEVPLYVWVGPASGPMFGSGSTWRRIYVGAIGAGTEVPITFLKKLVYADNGIVPGKTYAYALADGVSQSANIMGDSTSGKVFWCFTTAKPSVPCPAQGQQDPAVNEVGPLQPTIESIVASDSLLKTVIKGTLKSLTGTMPDVDFKILYRQKGTSNLSQESLYTGPVSSLGVSFQSELSDMIKSAEYDYYFVDAGAANKSYEGGTFSMAVTGNQVVFAGPQPNPLAPGSGGFSPTSATSSSNGGGGSGGTTSGNGTATGNLSGTTGGPAVNGACGPAASGTPVTVITASSANLCSKGTVSGFTGTGPWSWSCKGANGGTTASCTATQTQDEDYGEGYLKNPLAPGLDTFPKIFAAVFNNIVLPIAGPFLAIMYIYSGFLFVSARKKGSVSDLEQAQRTFRYTTYGAVIILGATVAANAIQGTISEIISGTSV